MAAERFVHPHPVPLDPGEFVPSVHWAEHQRIAPVHGAQRRLYDGELMFVFAGSMAVQFADLAEPLIYERGDLLVIPPAVRHQVSIVSAPAAQLLGVHFDLYDELDLTIVGDMVVAESAFRPDWVCRWPFVSDGVPAFERRYRGVPREIVGWMEEIGAEFKAQRTGFELACRGYMQLIVTALLRLRSDRRRQAPTAYREPLEQIAEEMQVNLQLPFANADMAKRLNISEDHYIRLFRRRFEAAPQQYLQRLRHQAAKRYLRETADPIEQIGTLVGYDDPHQFSHVFKKWQGVSPRSYRNMFSIV
ncbi:AraC family transcriptional regulator [Paenibacillus cymbidii]|uniref:AraC family transcriptional regulator n=1 Tax=Paenibacillus cymbidii TaxID=1639034 RepID=UPI00107FF9CE|nr:AraC family transcriptional regulator [Paenibacillus cymbidii]